MTTIHAVIAAPPCEACGTNLETATRRGDRAVTLANHAARVARLAIGQLHQHDPAMANRLGVILRTGSDPARAPRPAMQSWGTCGRFPTRRRSRP